jgi:RNA polymerase sigma-70 factor (ECF subfamily)
MSDRDLTRDLLPAMAEARTRFMELVAEVRPELHRYCARMTGNVFDGEDIVQDTLAKAYFALSEMGEPPPLRGWLFRIAHNTAMDFLRRYERKNVDLVADVPDVGESEDEGPDPALVEAALTIFVSLPPVQRSAIVLKDVLGHSLEETASTMGNTVLAVKGALVRARANIAASASSKPSISAEEEKSLQRYADLFNARDWDGLRALMGEEARVDIVSRWQRRGSAAAGFYSRYAEIAAAEDLRAVAGFVDGAPVIAIYRPTSPRPAYFIRLKWEEGRIVQIRDFYYVPYIADEARFTKAPRASLGQESS